MRLWFETLIAPLGWIVAALVLLVVMAWWTRFPRRTLAVSATVVVVLIYLACTPLVANAFLAPLQAQARRDAARCGPPPAGTVFIVLAGGVDGEPDSARDVTELQLASLRRTIAATRIALRVPRATLLMSGGEGGRWREANLMDTLAQRLGFPAARILRDRDARTTFQSALDTARMLAGNPAPRYLVTSAYHMPRAYRSFVHSGQRVCALPVDFSKLPRHAVELLTPQTSALARLTLALHEYLGMLFYRWVKFQ